MESERKKIDGIDAKLLGLLEKRAALARKIGREKARKSLQVFDPAREAKVLKRLKKLSRGMLPEGAVEAIFREIISASRRLERPVQVAYLGPETTFTQAAAIKKFGSSMKFVPMDSIWHVFDAVEKGDFEYGVVPIENSTEGTVASTLDMFIESGLGIVGEVLLEVKHCLVSKYRKEEVNRVYSHPQALAQCRDWLSANLPKAETVETPSTAKAAEIAAARANSAAIASKLAARKHGLSILASNIQDFSRNFTRFLVIGKAMPARSGNDKTSIMFSVKHRPGALFKTLLPLQKHNINMTKIESRPTRNKPWEYVFFIDFTGHAGDAKLKRALGEMERECMFLRVLGSYPEDRP